MIYEAMLDSSPILAWLMVDVPTYIISAFKKNSIHSLDNPLLKNCNWKKLRFRQDELYRGINIVLISSNLQIIDVNANKRGEKKPDVKQHIHV